MKSIGILLFVFIMGYVHLSRADELDGRLKRLQSEMEAWGIALDVMDQNPFQTGTPLAGYMMSNTALLGERNVWFQLKANPLKSTENAADYAFRLKNLRSYANNIFLQMLKALEKNDKNEFAKEEELHQKDLEALVEECNKDANCVTQKLEDPNVSIKTNLISNLHLSAQLFSQIPYMHALEAHSIYQLIQLLYLETLYGQNRLAKVEFDLFLKKQKKLVEELAQNSRLSPTEQRMQLTLIENTVAKWKKKILERKFDQQGHFTKLATDLRKKNQETLASILANRKSHPALFTDLLESKPCGALINYKKSEDYLFCRSQNQDRSGVERELIRLKGNKPQFLGQREDELPKQFWEPLIR